MDSPVPCVPFKVFLSWHDRYRLHSLQWRHNERDGVSNHRRIDCLLNPLFRRRSKKNQSSASRRVSNGKCFPLMTPLCGSAVNQRQCCQALQRVIDRKLSCTCIVRSWSKHGALVDLSRRVYGRKVDLSWRVYVRKLTSKCNVNRVKNMLI